MRPTSESDGDVRSDAPRNDPWAAAPAHLRDDEDRPAEHGQANDTAPGEGERHVPEQRGPDHDGHLYASDTYDVAADDPERHEETAQAHEDAAQAHHEAATAHDQIAGQESTYVGVAPVDTTTPEDRPAVVPAPTDTAPTGTATPDTTPADRATPDTPADTSASDTRTSDTAPAEPAEDEPLFKEPEREPDREPFDAGHADVVAVPVDTGDKAEPVADRDHDGVADATPATELKPGDVPAVPVMAFLSAEVVQDLRNRWREAQLGFVDDPRQVAEDVKNLVNEAVDAFTAALSSQRDELNAASGNDTEEYRVTVQRSRRFFERLLNL